MVIGLDFGHGVSYDGGAIGIIKEEDVINAVGNELKQMLESDGHKVVLLRPSSANNLNDSLNKRCTAANSANVDLVVSIHANIGGGTRHEVLISAFGGQAEKYARNVYNALNELTPSRRGIKSANLYVLNNTKAPAILIEVLFLDTKADVDLYALKGSKSYAKAIFKGITGKEYIEKSKRYYIVTNYLKEDTEGYINMEQIVSMFEGVRFYMRHNPKGVWVESQYLDKEKCEELKGKLGELFWRIEED